jgi:hypothetical protein
MAKKHETVSLACPSCHLAQNVEVTTLVDIGEEPNMKYSILTDSLFTHTCASCGSRFSVTGELLCLNREAGYAILLSPDGEGKAVEAPCGLSGLTLRLVLSNDELKEKVLVFEELLDDRTIELLKLYIALRQSEQSLVLRFTEHRDGKLSFTCFDAEGNVLRSVSVEDSLYLELKAKADGFAVEKGKFVYVDSLWTMDRIENSRG